MTDYYQTHARDYFDETVHIDPAPFLGLFVRHLAAGARILDLGCGSGGIMSWLTARGFAVTGLERAPGLAALARKHAGCPVIEADFQTFDFSSLSVDAILCCGSLVHLPHHRLGGVLKRLSAAVGTGGGKNGPLLYLSVKEGKGSGTDTRGRTFYYWQDGELRPLFHGLGMELIDFMRSPSADGEEKTWLGYVLTAPTGAG
jgi:SAM-dependent methyltransferase